MSGSDVTILPAAMKAWRKERGFSQEGLAEASGISAGMVAQVETGRRQLGVANLVAVAEALDVSPHALALITIDLSSLDRGAA